MKVGDLIKCDGQIGIITEIRNYGIDCAEVILYVAGGGYYNFSWKQAAFCFEIVSSCGDNTI